MWDADLYGQPGDGTTSSSFPMTQQGHTGNAGVPTSVTVTSINATGSASTTINLVGS